MYNLMSISIGYFFKYFNFKASYEYVLKAIRIVDDFCYFYFIKKLTPIVGVKLRSFDRRWTRALKFLIIKYEYVSSLTHSRYIRHDTIYFELRNKL